MKVIALGGPGGMGRVAVRTLASSDAVTEIVVADKDIAAAERFAGELGVKASAREADAGDEDALVSLMSGADIVVNTCGPFFKFGVSAVRAAIQAKTNYCDINDDWRPTQEVLALDEEAKAAGVTAIVGIGVSPGISNLMAMHGAAQLDEVEEVLTCWLVDAEIDPSAAPAIASYVRSQGHADAALEHMIFGASGNIPTFRDGRWVDIESFETSTEVEFPGTGRAMLYNIGHPEPVTLPPYLPGVKSVSNLGGLFPPQLNDLVRDQVKRVTTGEINAREGSIAFIEAIGADPERWLARPAGVATTGMCAIVIGAKDGRRARYTVGPAGAPAGGMAGATGVPLAIAALRVMRGEVTTHGVIPPEACFEPLPFIEEYSSHWDVRLGEGTLLLESLDLLA